MAPKRKPQSIHQIKVSLKNIRPPIWRRLQVDSRTTLGSLHNIIQAAMGWG
ncbi:MAG: plasmid pRiA4b ORF-3 family protein, partial [Anaerolineae bacterium]